MSQKNVEKVRRGFAEYNRGDIEEALEEWAPDAVWGRDCIEVEARSAWLVTFQDGEQTSLTLYQTKRDALEAVGLRE